MKRHNFSKMFRDNGKGLTLDPSTRVLKVEDLESRILLSTTQGISATEFNDIKAQYAGFDYSSINNNKVYVVDATSASLRDAVRSAKASSGADMIVIKTTDTTNKITFTSSESFVIDDSSSLIIVAYGSKNLTIDAADQSRIFEIKGSGKTQIANMSLTGGAAENGGAILNTGNIILDRLNIYENNATGKGGGIYSTNKFEIVNSIISDNKSKDNGGGIYIDKTAYTDTILKNYITNSTIANNTAGENGECRGGGIYFDGYNQNFEKQNGEIPFHANIYIFNSIITNNIASNTIDSNIFNSFFYIEDKEIGVSDVALIGFYNLSTFNFWGSDDPDHPTPFNISYNQVINLFTDDSVRDYSLMLMGDNDSQAIDTGSTEKAYYLNGQQISYDLYGNLRIINDKVDLGACEYVLPYIDLSTINGGTLISETSLNNNSLSLIDGQKLQIKGITVTNNDERFTSEKFAIRFYLSKDSTIAINDILAKEIIIDPIAKKSTCSVDSGILITNGMEPGESYYVGWIIGAVQVDGTLNDNVLTNNNAYCTTMIKVLSNASDFKNNVSIKLGSETIQQGCGLELAVDTDDFDKQNFTYWWNYGNGYYVKGEKEAYISSNQLNKVAGKHTISLYIVNNDTQKVVGKGSSELTVLKVPPTILVEQTSFLSNKLIKLDLNVSYYDRYAQKWTINWGDGNKTEVTDNPYSQVLLHYYTGTGAFTITLKLIDSESEGNNVLYTITKLNLPSSANAFQATDVLSSETKTNLTQTEELQISESAPLVDKSLVAAPVLDFVWENSLNSHERTNRLLLISSGATASLNRKSTETKIESDMKNKEVSLSPIVEEEKKTSIFEKEFSLEELDADYLNVAVLQSNKWNEKDNDDLFDFLNENEI